MTYKGFNEFFCTWTEQKLQRSYVSPSVGRGCDPRTLPSHGWRLQMHTDFLDVAWPCFVDYSMHRVIKHAPVFKTDCLLFTPDTFLFLSFPFLESCSTLSEMLHGKGMHWPIFWYKRSPHRFWWCVWRSTLSRYSNVIYLQKLSMLKTCKRWATCKTSNDCLSCSISSKMVYTSSIDLCAVLGKVTFKSKAL